MRSFFREYALAILSAVVLMILIMMCTPVGDTTKRAILQAIGLYQESAETVKLTFYSGGGKFNTLDFQNSHLNDSDVYISEDTIIVTVEKGTLIEETDIPKPTKDGYSLIDENTYYFTDDNQSLVVGTTKATKDISYTAKYKSATSSEKWSGTGIKNGVFYVNNKYQSEFKVGTTFTWHNFKWRVLKIESNQVLILSENVLDSSYDAESFKNGVDYTSSTQTCAGQQVKNCYRGSALETAMTNFYSSSAGMNKDSAIVNTRDVSVGVHGSEYMYSSGAYNPYVFSLSYEEIQKYLTSDQKRVAYNGSSAMSYWLRSGERIETETCVEGKNSDGVTCKNNNSTITYDDTQDCFVDFNGELKYTASSTKLGIRPAMWVNLKAINDGEFIFED